MHLRTFLSLSLCPGVPLSWGPFGLLANAQRGARSSRQPGGMGWGWEWGLPPRHPSEA